MHQNSAFFSSPIAHNCYHKCLTLYFDRVFRKLSERIGLTYQYEPKDGKVPSNVDVVLFPHGEMDWNAVPVNLRGSHIVRDPRDLLVSAYHYHLRTTEEWCAKPNPAHKRLGADESYQDRLHSLSQEDGILFELSNVSGAIINSMSKWPYGDERILELRFEAMVGNEREHFQKIFEWYGMPEEHLTVALDIAESLSLKKLPSNAEGLQHARPGSKHGQWREFFTPKIKAAFKERYADAVLTLGYESHHDW